MGTMGWRCVATVNSNTRKEALGSDLCEVVISAEVPCFRKYFSQVLCLKRTPYARTPSLGSPASDNSETVHHKHTIIDILMNRWGQHNRCLFRSANPVSMTTTNTIGFWTIRCPCLLSLPSLQSIHDSRMLPQPNLPPVVNLALPVGSGPLRVCASENRPTKFCVFGKGEAGRKQHSVGFTSAISFITRTTITITNWTLTSILCTRVPIKISHEHKRSAEHFDSTRTANRQDKVACSIGTLKHHQDGPRLCTWLLCQPFCVCALENFTQP